jgi:hypothetical protein
VPLIVLLICPWKKLLARWKNCDMQFTRSTQLAHPGMLHIHRNSHTTSSVKVAAGWHSTHHYCAAHQAACYQ